MSIPTVDCAICGSTVPKRQTLLVKPYGRCCRKHPEAAQFIKAAAEQQDTDAKLKHGMENLQVIMAVEGVRVAAALRGPNVALRILHQVQARTPATVFAKVLTELEEKGALTAKELSDAAYMAASLLLKRAPEGVQQGLQHG